LKRSRKTQRRTSNRSSKKRKRKGIGVEVKKSLGEKMRIGNFFLKMRKMKKKQRSWRFTFKI
jgi:hypothetical protein